MILEMTCLFHIDQSVKTLGHSREICWRCIRNHHFFLDELPRIAKMTLDRCFDRSFWDDATSYNATSDDTSIEEKENEFAQEEKLAYERYGAPSSTMMNESIVHS